MPVIQVQTNHKNVPDGLEVRLALEMAKVMKRPESQIFVSLNTNSRMTRGQLTDPLAVLNVTSSSILTAQLTEEYTVALCEFFQNELSLDSDAVIINYRSISPELIGFNGHILTENRPIVTREKFIIGVLAIAILAFLTQFLKFL
uniref:Uncharacterized protein n=1 Tax=Caenorhabditis japonica TaxID=281687 RepID=A0A8R1DIK2_CAEJA